MQRAHDRKSLTAAHAPHVRHNTERTARTLGSASTTVSSIDSSHEFEPDITDRDSKSFPCLFVSLAILATVAIVIASAYYTLVRVGGLLDHFFPVSRELAGRSVSPGGDWMVRLYYVNPGASASAGYQAMVTSMSTGRERMILNTDDSGFDWVGDRIPIKWLDDHTVNIGGHVIDVVSGIESHREP
jgi:hypothetical protein